MGAANATNSLSMYFTNTPQCQLCALNFGYTFPRPHHCRHCNKCVCWLCSIYRFGVDIRICHDCSLSASKAGQVVSICASELFLEPPPKTNAQMKTLLGRFYKEGLGDGCYGIPLNVDRCFDLIGVAAAENDPGALFLLSELYAQEEPIKALSDQTPQERQNQRYKYLGRALNFGSIEAPILLAGLLKTFYSSYSQMEKVRSQIDAFEDPFAVEGVEPTCFCTLQIEKIDKFLVFHQQIIKDLDLHDLTFQEINANNDTCDAFKKFYLDSKILRDATLHHATIETKKKEIYELVQTEDKKLDPQIIQDIKNLGDEQILHFAKSVGQIFGEDYLNSPTITKILQISVLNSEQEKIEYEELYLSANQVYLRNVDTETGVVRSTDTPKRSFSKELFLQQRNGIGSKNAPVETKAGVYISLKDQKTVVDDELMEAVNKGDAEAQLNLGMFPPLLSPGFHLFLSHATMLSPLSSVKRFLPVTFFL